MREKKLTLKGQLEASQSVNYSSPNGPNVRVINIFNANMSARCYQV